MSVTSRGFNEAIDRQRISDLLIAGYREGNRDGNFFEPAWEYMLFHPMFDFEHIDRFRIWEDDGELVAMVNYEMLLGEAYFELKEGYEYLKPEMLDHAERNFFRTTSEGKRVLNVFVSTLDTDFENIVRERGYVRNERGDRPMTVLDLTKPLPEAKLPNGYRLSSLAEDNDLAQVNRVMWRGFNHGDGPEKIDYIGTKLMQSAPGFQPELNTIIIDKNGDYVCYTGTWYEPNNRYAYVEPVCTDPDHRRTGLASTSLFEALRRCAEKGATVGYVGSLLPLYRSMGFEYLFTFACWTKEL